MISSYFNKKRKNTTFLRAIEQFTDYIDNDEPKKKKSTKRETRNEPLEEPILVPIERILSTTVEDKPGVLDRVIATFTRRGCNIISKVVGYTEIETISRIITVVQGEDKVLEQIIKEISKQEHVVDIEDLTFISCVVMEAMIATVKVDQITRSEVFQLARVFKAKINDVGEHSVMITMLDEPLRVRALKELLEKYGLIRLVSSGKLVSPRVSGLTYELI